MHSLLVIRNGFLVSENYFAGNNSNSRHELYSVTKSFTSTLFGIALDKGLIKDMSPNWVEYILDTPMRSQPGSEFNYCSGCSHVLSAVVQQAAGINTGNFATAYLFAPLGIIDYTWDKDAQDVPIGGWGLHLTPRDMAKLGYLYLRRGNWDGQQIISEAWVDAATRRQIDTDGEWGYGYQWWR